jgi:hypothetical protein
VAINLLLGNLAPPVFPLAHQWEDWVARTVPANLARQLQANFEPALAKFQLPDLQTEETAGLGCGLTLLLLALLVKRICRGGFWPDPFWSLKTLVPLGVWAGIGVFILRVGIAGPARYLLPFYPLLILPVITGPGAVDIFRRRIWRGAAGVIFAVAGLLVVLSPQRPLWPAATVLPALHTAHPENAMVTRAWKVYSVYGDRADCFAPVIQVLPPDATTLGMVTFDEPEASLWRPFGSRRIVHIMKSDDAGWVRDQGLKYALVSEAFLAHHTTMDSAGWLARYHAEKIADFKLQIHAGQEPEGWFLARFP